MKKIGIFLACAAAVIAITSQDGRAGDYGKCGFDSDCHRGVKCKSGKCADSAGSSCGFDSDCGVGKGNSGKCSVAPDGKCGFDSDCGPGRKCSSQKCQ